MAKSFGPVGAGKPKWILIWACVVGVCGAFLAGTGHAQFPPQQPAPDPAGPAHIFYGLTPPGADTAPVLFFVHGLSGRAADWWQGNDMYMRAYVAGYRTAFVSLSLDNSKNNSSIADNAAVLKDALPRVLAHMAVPKVYAICHSKGGLDLQAAMMDASIAAMIQGVVTIATPNTGSELADWAFGPGQAIAGPLGLLTPAVADLKVGVVAALRAQWDPVLAASGIPFYTIEGDRYTGLVLTEITGPILASLTPGVPNDGLVPLTRARLPAAWAIDLGVLHFNHFALIQGTSSFSRANEGLTAGEKTVAEFRRISHNGFGDRANTFIWSLEWFKNRLYAGTGRVVECVSIATSDAQSGTHFYPPRDNPDCTPDPRDLRLAAEIWRYTPETKVWELAYRSPVEVPVDWDSSGKPTKFIARDIAYRGMIVHREANGTDALYVAGVGASSIFEKLPYYQQNSYPPPRILRTTDGVNWAPLPQTPGTFLGDIYKNSTPLYVNRGFRSFASYNGNLFVTASDFRGVGRILASPTPEQGNNAWSFAGPAAEQMPVWTLKTFNNFLYCTTGDSRYPTGYGVYKTKASGSPPYPFTPVVTGGGEQSAPELRSPLALSLEEFQGRLYVGSDRPTEMLRINPDDTWEVVVGYPRMTSQGQKNPISGIGEFFGNVFTGHFYAMRRYNGRLYVGTWDWSLGLRILPPLNNLFGQQYGTDVYRTEDGVYWTFITKQGFGDPFNYGTRSFSANSFGLFLGGTKPLGGAEIYLSQYALDFNHDGAIDRNDVNLLTSMINQPVTGPEDPRDIDRDGKITVLDVRKLVTQCTLSGCAPVTPAWPKLPPPRHLQAASVYVVGNQVKLTWDPVPGAATYWIFRSQNRPFSELFPKPQQLQIPGTGITITVPDDFLNGRVDTLCRTTPGEANPLCALSDAYKASVSYEGAGYPLPFLPIAHSDTTSFNGVTRFPLQSIYYVAAVDAQGHLSDPSNVVGAPSFAAPTTLKGARQSVSALMELPASTRSNAEGALAAAETAAASGDYRRAAELLRKAASKQMPAEADYLLSGAAHTLRLIADGVYRPEILEK